MTVEELIVSIADADLDYGGYQSLISFVNVAMAVRARRDELPAPWVLVSDRIKDGVTQFGGPYGSQDEGVEALRRNVAGNVYWRYSVRRLEDLVEELRSGARRASAS